MSTAKNIIFIGLYLENCCLVMGWGRDKNLVGVFFLVWGMSKFLAGSGGGRCGGEGGGGWGCATPLYGKPSYVLFLGLLDPP